MPPTRTAPPVSVPAGFQPAMQELCNSRLPPFPIPLDEMTDYTTVKNCFNAMFTAEGFKEDWKVGDNPPASVVSWWGGSNCRRSTWGTLSLRIYKIEFLKEIS